MRQVVREGKKPSEVASVYGITIRRVQQLVAFFRKEKSMPELNPLRRPRTFLAEEQKAAIDAAFKDTKLSPRLLYYELQRRKMPVPKNKLYEHMKAQGTVVPDPNKQKQRKRCRYERKHSGSLVHIDWHRTSIKHPYCILYEDDASRFITGYGEFWTATTDHAIDVFDAAIKKWGKPKQVLSRPRNTILFR